MRQLIVPVSGGKDSQMTLSLAIRQGLNPVCVHQNTGYDHPLTYRHMILMERFYSIKIEHTKSRYGDMFGFLEHAQYFPNSAARGCTQRLKQEPFAEWLISRGFNNDNSVLWFGMRTEESKNRENKYQHLSPFDEFELQDIATFYGQRKFESISKIPCVLPIVQHTTGDVFKYLHEEKAPINKLYEKGHHRVGCYPCLLARKAEWMAAGRDSVGQEHIKKLIQFEERWKKEGNPRKFIKVHRTWDVRLFLEDNPSVENLPDENIECGYCSI